MRSHFKNKSDHLQSVRRGCVFVALLGSVLMIPVAMKNMTGAFENSTLGTESTFIAKLNASKNSVKTFTASRLKDTWSGEEYRRTIAQQNSLDPILDTPIPLGAVAFQKLLPLIRF